VGSDAQLRGVITDRDIVIRALAYGKNPMEERVRDYMTENVFCCNENDFIEDAAQKMKSHKVGRLIVKNASGAPVGILSFGGILRKEADAHEVANVIKHASGVQ